MRVEINLQLPAAELPEPGKLAYPADLTGQVELLLVTDNGRATNVTGVPDAIPARQTEQGNYTQLPHEPSELPVRDAWHSQPERSMAAIMRDARIRRQAELRQRGSPPA